MEQMTRYRGSQGMLGSSFKEIEIRMTAYKIKSLDKSGRVDFLWDIWEHIIGPTLWCTEMRFVLCTWFGEFCSFCSLTPLPKYDTQMSAR